MPCGFKAFLVATLLMAIAGAPAPAAENTTMRVGIESMADPISFERADGEIDGFAVDIVNAISRDMNFSVQPVVAPWPDLLVRFKAGQIDVLASVAYTKERDDFIDFAVSHLVMEGAIFVRKGDRSIHTAADLATRRVGVQTDGFSHNYLRAHGWDRHLVSTKNLQDALEALDEGRCDAVTAVRIVGAHIIRQQHLKNVEAIAVPLPDFTFRMHVGVRAGDADRLAILNEGLAHIRANGTYDAIYEKWIGPLEPRHLRLQDLRTVLLPVGLVALVTAGVLLWQRRLLLRLAERTARLRESEERLRRVLDGSEDGFWDWDMETGRIERSERWAAMLGYTLAEIGPTLDAGEALVHPDDRALYEVWQRRRSSRADDRCDIEYRMRAKSGEWRWILDRGKVVARTPAGAPRHMAGTHTDITERKRTEAALLESQTLARRTAQLLEQTQAIAHIGGWETDLFTGRVFWTAETYRLHETSPDQFQPTRETVYAFYTPESRVRLANAVEAAVRDGTPYTLDLELISAKGRRRHVQITGAAEKEGGRVVKLYGSHRDTTAEHLAEQDREMLRLKMLEAQKLESLGVLAGGIAHDFNNLLTVILANAAFARSDGPTADCLGQIESAARRAADLCRQMLAYAGRGNFVVGPLDVGALVRDTTQLIQVSISKKARLELDLADALPAVEGDASQLRQVVMNLVINASEALGDAPGEIRISTFRGLPDAAPHGATHLFELPPGECVCLEIADTGSGMSAATLARIFEPFFTTKFAGRGLGLAAVLGIVRSHRGALTVDSAPGRGSTFRFFLPPAQVNSGAVSTNTPFAAPATRTGGRLLVADDETILRETIAAVLRHRGFEPVCVADGHAAVERFKASPGAFRAVLLDLTMPRLDGAEALRVIRTMNPSVPAIVMSGFGEQEVIDRLRGVGPVTVVRKPFTPDKLLARILEAIG